jgi:hypothetical protein
MPVPVPVQTLAKKPDELRRRRVAAKSARAVLKALGTKLSGEEAELLVLVRGKDAPEFTLTIGCNNGHWAVRFDAPGSVHTVLEGFGATFVEAWEDQSPSWPAP